jgi:hypothetical protein
MPSTTPSCASQAAMAEFTAAWCLAVVTVPPAMSLFTHWRHTEADEVLVCEE